MTTYDMAAAIPKEQRARMIASGLLPRSVERDIYIYEMFRRIIADGSSKMDAYTRISMQCFTCEENVRRIVRRMGRAVK